MPQFIHSSLAGVCLLVLFFSVARGEDDTATEEAKAWHARRMAECAEFEVVRGTSPDVQALKLEKPAILSWSNPIRKTAAGAVFLWTEEGQPRLIASCYRYEQGIEYEFTSLAADPLVLRRNGRDEHHFTPGVTWQELTDVDPPHKQRSLRLTQMRRIAERIQVRGNGGNPFEARLLTQPIYRTPADAKVECAVFAFVLGTDPEAVLMIEATNNPGWRFAFGRMSTIPLSANLDEQRVWELPACWNVRLQDQQPFRTMQFPGAN